MHEVQVAGQSLERFLPLVGPERLRVAHDAVAEASRRLAGRVCWNVNSTARGGGVAEMLAALLPYARGAGIDARWLVVEGNPDFFRITKRLHHALHGASGDRSPLGEAERAGYEDTLRAAAKELLAVVRPHDVVLLHDPQTAGLVPSLAAHGAVVVWRCHVGTDDRNRETDLAWAFLSPYLEEAAATVFSRGAYVPDCCRDRSVVIAPSIDVFSAKNEDFDAATVRAILVHTGLVEGTPRNGSPVFRREDGTPARVDRQADIVRLGRAPSAETPLVVQVSRWDPLKDPIGVMRGFAGASGGEALGAAHLVLAGPNVMAVTDDPEGAATFDAVLAAWRELPHSDRRRVHLASLPMADVDENAAIVNALQRHAAVVVQKSLREGFGLTVTEAMWKARPVVAGRVGGILDQITDGVDGLLVEPGDSSAFGAALERVLADRAFAARLGAAARTRVVERFLAVRHLVQYAELLDRVEEQTA